MSKMSLRQEITVWILMGFFMIIAGWATYVAKSEEAKRIELEAENKKITSIIVRVVKSSMRTRHTMPDCYRYQGEISFLIAEYYGHQVESVDVEIFYQDLPDSGRDG